MQLYSWKIIASNMNLSLLIFSLFSFLCFFFIFIATLLLYLTLYLCIFDKPVASAMPINSPSKSMMLFNRNFFASKQRRNFFLSQSDRIDYVIWQNLSKTILWIWIDFYCSFWNFHNQNNPEIYIRYLHLNECVK